MDKNALQEKFEDIAIQNCWNINKYPAGWDCHSDDEYVDELVNGAWWVFQHQQAKVEELEKEWLEMNQKHEQAVKECFEVNSENRKLQKRVDAALKETQFALQYVEEDMRGNHEFLQMAMIRTLKALEQVLKGGESK